MARAKQTAADYIERHDGEMRVILGELVENAGKINMHWVLGRDQAREYPEAALKHLIDAEILLGIIVRIERSDALRTIHSAIDRLGSELPDDGDDHSSDPPSGDITGH